MREHTHTNTHTLHALNENNNKQKLFEKIKNVMRKKQKIYL